MPYSFTQIEKDKTKTISLVFFSLILFYFGVFWLIGLLVKSFILYENTSTALTSLSRLTLSDSLTILAMAILVGYIHWTCTVNGLVEKVSRVLRAEPLNPNDNYHQRLQNIINEVSIATGGEKIEGMVIPTTAMNAFALMDFQGRAIIGVTEGLLARLTRSQLEAVVAHEAAHIVTGDCLTTTVTTSIFALYSGLLSGLTNILRGTRSSSRRGAGMIALIICVYFILWLSRLLTQLARMFISRQREYRADAIAVRLTRDPLSLAEALYAIGYRWRGAGLASEELESIFIINPVYSALDEKNNLFADLFSTHPPIKKRLQILLDMAHTNLETVIKNLNEKNISPRISVTQFDAANLSVQWMVNRNGLWEGPFGLTQLSTLEGMRPEVWVQRLGTANIKMAYEDKDIINAINNKTSGEGHCPKCAIPLTIIVYEGVEVNKCSFCHGVLVDEQDIQRIIIREEVGFSDEITHLADGILNQNKTWLWGKGVINRDPATLLSCPRCQQSKQRMMRMFYTEAYHVEIDKCLYCGSIWFDKNELELLQCLIEKQTGVTRLC